ncbi:hypothetical protein [Haloplanus salilacus]|uniref:hypothetical protein n=1 Tax=Haloplanus salilacus TaxID=2949994 RepID=UPI0030CAD0C9
MSTQKPTENVEELSDLVRKSEGIISTFEARSLKDEPETVEDDYRRYAQTHVSLGDTSEFENEIYETVIDEDSATKGYLYGPYGYGKTSTSVSIWHTLSDNDIIAVPPFTMDSFAAVMRATYGWLRYEFQNKAPGYVDDLDDIHERYLQQELQSVAKQKEGQHDLDFDKLVAMFEEMEQENDLDLSINADTLIDFFDECTEVAVDAGFEALVIIGDELQEYFNSADNEKDAESRFRRLVFGLQAGAQIRDEFGLFISMPEKTKSMLDSRAEDILNRLQRDNLTLNLQNVYGREFPAELWDRYADQFNFADQKHEIISESALKATGEVCSRNDISNGPRTVMDIFRLALSQYEDQQETFTALDLADCFYQGEVRYQGSSTKTQTAIGDALDHSAVDTEEKQKFLKLCAVFPVEGIPDGVVEEYGLGQAETELSKKFHGEVIKVVSDGYTLVDLTRTETTDPIRELIRDFWREYGVGEAAAADAVEALANNLLAGEILEPQRGTLDGWTNGGKDFNKLDHTAFKDQFEGTFDTRFPKRRISVGVCDDRKEDEIISSHESLGEFFGAPDLGLNFVLAWQKGGDEVPGSHIREESDREYTFVLDARQSFDELPKGLDFLRDAMDPKAVTPFLMLALVHYLDDPPAELDAQQQQRVESFQQSLLDQSLKALFDEQLITNAPYELRRAGKRAVEGLFTKAMESLYPNYHTVIASPQYRGKIDNYIDFLESLETTSKRKGTNTVVEETTSENNSGKHAMAARFGLRQTSSFDNSVKKHYGDLLTIVDDDADHYEVRAELHPLEEEILAQLEAADDDTLAVTDAEDLALEKGYRDEELEVIAELIQRRGLAVYDELNNALVLQETDVTIEDVEHEIEDCREKIETIEQLEPNRVPDGVPERIDELAEELGRTNADDGEKLERLKVDAEHITVRLEEVGELLYNHYESECSDVQRDAKRTRRDFIPSHLEDDVVSGVGFVGGLNDARTELLADFRDLNGELSSVIEAVEDAQKRYDSRSLEAALELHSEAESARDTLRDIEEQIDELEEYADELEQWRTFADRVGNVKEDIQDYSRTFDESIREETDIEEFIGEIHERLAESPIDALTNREAFEERLDQIEEAYQQRREERREVFNAKQETLNEILDEATGGKAGRLRVTFDVKQPDESRRRLFEDFKDEYQSQVLDQAEKKLNNAENEVEYAQIVGIEAETEADPDHVAEQIEQAEATLRGLRGTLSRFELADIGDETDLGSEGATLLTTADELQHEARGFRAQTDPDDEELQDLLERINENRGPDFKELLMEYHEDGEDISVDELLTRVEQLFKLNQIDIKITERRGRR